MARKRNNSRKNINRKTKVHLVFDEAARREFLTGFHSRKMQRKKKAKEEFQRQLKEEKKRLKLEAKKALNNIVSPHHIDVEPIQPNSEEINLENHCIRICEISTDEISTENNWIGENKVEYDGTNDSSTEKLDTGNDSLMLLKSEKDIKRILKKKAALNAKQSKPLQKQNQQQSKKNRKMSQRKKKLKSILMKHKNRNQ